MCEKYIPLLILKGKQGGSRTPGEGCRKKIRGAYAPVPFWFTGLFMVFPKTSAAGYFPDGLYMDFLRSSQRPHPVTTAPRKPDGLYGDHLPAHTKTSILFLPAGGLFMGFSWSLRRPFSGAYKDHLPERKKAATRAVFKDWQSSSSINQLI